ncbi:hypothetical protein CRM22_007076 [Opisthorchis felineus]|uniref:Cilia- and flagella-associated protein 418 n=1 Tax=Opisthorchis felineus TaxID=147828 RepID=A0A4V3SE43_OPIFE|nr:hypothetical protein CRM22_007076 [Opisthorchis felineus]
MIFSWATNGRKETTAKIQKFSEIFTAKSWSSDVDYYFLRTNYPNTKRLQTKMKRKGGSRAYCCQCSSTEATKLTCLDGIPSLQWVCGKHAM